MSWWKKSVERTLCTGCDQTWPTCAMNWDSIGQYRCRECNPDPGPPSDTQSPQQNARSKRYDAVKRDKVRGYRCTECGSRIRKDHYLIFGCMSQEFPGLDLVYRSYGTVIFCSDCAGENPHSRGLFGMTLVRM